MMINKTTKPRRRFKGFVDDWEQRKLGDISEIRTGPFGSVLHAEDYVSSGTPIVTTEHFKSGALPIEKEDLPQVSDADYHRLSSYKLEIGDIVFSRVGSVDINALVEKEQDGWLFSGRVLRVRPQGTINGRYLHYLLETKSVKDDIISRAVGQTMPSINTEILNATEIKMANSEDERYKIGEYFANIDNIIALHQQKLGKLNCLKKAYLSEMFPAPGERKPKRRFAGFTDVWVQRKLGDIVDVCSGRDYKHLDEGDIPVYGTGGYMLSVSEALSEKDDAIGIGRKGTIDKPYVLKAPFWTVDTLFYCIPKMNYDLDFVYATYQKIDWKSMDESTGVPSLSKNAINAVSVAVPNKDEQTRIGQHFKNIDSLIDLHQRKLEKLQALKKAYLSEMFI